MNPNSKTSLSPQPEHSTVITGDILRGVEFTTDFDPTSLSYNDQMGAFEVPREDGTTQILMFRVHSNSGTIHKVDGQTSDREKAKKSWFGTGTYLGNTPESVGVYGWKLGTTTSVFLSPPIKPEQILDQRDSSGPKTLTAKKLGSHAMRVVKLNLDPVKIVRDVNKSYSDAKLAIIDMGVDIYASQKMLSVEHNHSVRPSWFVWRGEPSELLKIGTVKGRDLPIRNDFIKRLHQNAQRRLKDREQDVPRETDTSLLMSGDLIIQNPEVAYDTVVDLRVSADKAWSGRFGVTRMGEVADGYAGLLLPQIYDPILRENLRSLPEGADEPKQLEVGDVITDGKGDVQVVEIDDETRTILFESVYSPQSDGKKPMHYTWQIRIEKGVDGGPPTMLSRTRMEDLKNPRAGKFLWPRVDKMAVKILAEGIARDDSDTSRKPLKSRLGARAINGAGKIATYKRARFQE